MNRLNLHVCIVTHTHTNFFRDEIKICIKNFYVYEDFTCLNICAPHVCLVPKMVRRERMSDSLELELWMLVNYCVGARNQTQVFCKTS